jgi:bud emergence protein 1
MYDFKAERPDELDAQAGEAIVVIAQSNHEWFVAKPIGRLGGPGLIPVSFVQVRDAQTGELIDERDHHSITVPGVDDWKKMTLNYEASSIPLGVFEKSGGNVITSTPTTPTIPIGKTRLSVSTTSASSVESTKELLPVTFASVDSFILEGDQYWFVIYARVNQGSSHRILYRLYEGKSFLSHINTCKYILIHILYRLLRLSTQFITILSS